MKNSEKITLNLILSAFLICLTVWSYAAVSPKKIKRLTAKADKYYENFAYAKAARLYEKTTTYTVEEMDDIYVKIADSYRLMNNTVSAEKWYEKAEGSTAMKDQDKLNYSQILLVNGKEDKAKQVVRQITSADIMLTPRMATIENQNIFYDDSAAYAIQNLNINSNESDFSPTYYEDGIVFVSNRKNKKFSQSTYYWDETYFLDLYFSKATESGYEEPQMLTKQINTMFHEGPATFFDGNSKVIFTRNNFNLGEERTSAEGINKLKLYYAEKNKKGKWSKPVALPFTDDNYSYGHPTMSTDGTEMYFSSDMPGTYGKADIWKVSYLNGNWGIPENMGSEINTIENEIFPFINENHVLYFSSEGHPGLGGLDIYYVNLYENRYTVENPGYPVNTKDDDFGMIFMKNKGYLSSNRPDGVGKDDIYKIEMYTYDIRVRLIDSLSGEPIKGNIAVLASRDEQVIEQADDVYNVSFETLRGRSFIIDGQSEGYFPKNLKLSTLDYRPDEANITFSVPLTVNFKPISILYVKNILKSDQILTFQPETTFFEGSESDLPDYLKENGFSLDTTFTVRNIHYDFDRFNIRAEAAKELDQLVDVLHRYSELLVEFGAHTDNRGSILYNERLAQKRALSAKQYLVNKGINQNRVIVKSYGKQSLLIPCDKPSACTEKQHELNRRTEVTILKSDD